MLFHTLEFVVFFIITMAGYLALKKTRWWCLWLLLASYFFYGWWNPLFLILIFYSTLVDYFVGLRLEVSERKRMWLVFSLVNNLALLGFFKYAGFFTENLNYLFSFLNLPLIVPKPDILLPVGISFFTFQSMSYSIDVYKGDLRVEHNFVRFAAFVALFPQLVAGPIERAKALLPQLRHKPVILKSDVSDGISLFLVGLFKKVVMADFLSLYVDRVYEDPTYYSSVGLVMATVAFAWQIYFDFSGYTDMARGVAKAMGIRLMLNFNNPYTAISVSDFWQRWHISLSSWFRDYVYIPLGGNRGFKYRVYWNVIFTMVISGFWHGAGWGFVIWGALNGFGNILNRGLERRMFYSRIPKIIKQVMVFCFICVTWVFFRADVGDAWTILVRIFSFAGGETEFPLFPFVLVGLVWTYQLIFNSRFRFLLESTPVRIGCAVAAAIMFIVFSTTAQNQFIYFQF